MAQQVRLASDLLKAGKFENLGRLLDEGWKLKRFIELKRTRILKTRYYSCE